MGGEDPETKFNAEIAHEVFDVIAHPPHILAVHTYPTKEDYASGSWPAYRPGEAEETIKAVVDLIVQIHQQNKPIPMIVVSGGHDRNYAGFDVSEIYAEAIEKLLKEKGIKYPYILNESRIKLLWPKLAFSEKVHDTTAVTRFLKHAQDNSLLIGNTILSISRLPHIARTVELQAAYNIKAKHLSVEGILSYLKGENYYEVFESYKHAIVADTTLADGQATSQLAYLEHAIAHEYIAFRFREVILRVLNAIDAKGRIPQKLASVMQSALKEKIMSLSRKKSK